MHNYNKILILLLFFGFQYQSSNSQNDENSKPNVIFFLVDDLGWMDTSYQGSSFYETPEIDKVAGESMRFNQAYSAHPRCVPSRYAMITGKYPARMGIPSRGDKDIGKLNPSEFGLAKAFKESGYTTFFAGKWHLSSNDVFPQDQGFDINIAGGHAGAPRSYFYPYNESKRKSHNAKKIKGLEDGKEGDYLTDVLTEKTLSFIKENKDKPFFVYLSHYGVHTPFEGKEELKEKYKNKIEKSKSKEPEFIKVGDTGETKTTQDNVTYASMVESVDQSFGKIIKLIDELGLEDNTIIVFTSDHGGLSNRGNTRSLATSNLPLRAGKGHVYEGGIRVPMFVKWPGITKGSETDTYITGTDYYPTLVEIAGLKTYENQYLDGKSFAKTLKKGSIDNCDRPIFWHSPMSRPNSTGDTSNTAVRLGDYKLIDFYEEGYVELYNIKKDIGETNNLAQQLPKKRNELLTLVNNWRKDVNAWTKKK